MHDLVLFITNSHKSHSINPHPLQPNPTSYFFHHALLHVRSRSPPDSCDRRSHVYEAGRGQGESYKGSCFNTALTESQGAVKMAFETGGQTEVIEMQVGENQESNCMSIASGGLLVAMQISSDVSCRMKS